MIRTLIDKHYINVYKSDCGVSCSIHSAYQFVRYHCIHCIECVHFANSVPLCVSTHFVLYKLPEIPSIKSSQLPCNSWTVSNTIYPTNRKKNLKCCAMLCVVEVIHHTPCAHTVEQGKGDNGTYAFLCLMLIHPSSCNWRRLGSHGHYPAHSAGARSNTVLPHTHHRPTFPN